MKKTLLVILAVLCSFTAMAQDEKAIKTRRPKYVNLGYVLQQDVTLETGEVLKPEFGATLNRGRTYYLHKRPIAKFLSFGIDATWIDLNYAMYKPHKFMTYDETSLHQAEIAMQVGPSITLNPVKRLQMHLYGRFVPTFAICYDGDVVGGNYASLFVAGGNISFGFFGIGAEYRKGAVNYKEFGGGALSGVLDDADGEDYTPEEAYTMSSAREIVEPGTVFGSKNVLEGLRIYITFRF